ncbi:hypothetical protein [Nonomuraea sp. PA05]|uniref:hypothetical protein n=1 Tax=Nonomuraea sp. PA05 TaxID=2604466 RepID=UPI001651D67F|nr:hypothetical protein [Nonomuraea sp. PA05]
MPETRRRGLDAPVSEVAGPRRALWAAGVVIVVSPVPVYAALREVRDVTDA